MLESAVSGRWITFERIQLYSLILLVLLGSAIVWWFAQSDGLLNASGQPVLPDFSNVWSAGKLALQGAPQVVYNPAAHYAKETELFGGTTEFFGWHYPPMLLLVAAALATMPYITAGTLWLGATFIAYMAAIASICRRREVLIAATVFTAVPINLLYGQNGYLSAALFAGGMTLLERRPVAAGILIGLLAYKPHFGLLLPLALVAGGYWRAIISATITVLITAGLSYAVLGIETWVAFLQSAEHTRTVVLEAGGAGWHKIMSLFAAARMMGSNIETAYALQLGLAAALGVSIWFLWRSNASRELKYAALATSSLLISPYLFSYDMVLLGPAILWLAMLGVRQGFLPHEKNILLLVWAIPFPSAFIAEATSVPVGFISMALLYIFILRRAWLETASRVRSGRPA